MFKIDWKTLSLNPRQTRSSFRAANLLARNAYNES